MTRSAAATRPEGAGLRASARRSLAVALLSVAVGALAIQRALGLGSAYPPAAVGVALLGAWAVAAHLPGRHPHPLFGAANTVTLARGVLTSLVFALVLEPETLGGAVFAAAAGTLAALLDGLDGRLARRRGEASDFGARFDMETDALLVLALAALAWRWDRAGAWVLLSGLLRYAFVAAGWLAPWLRCPLPPSRRRQAVCVLQIAVLLAVVAPQPVPGASAPLALAGLLLLATSFALDVAWLAGRGAASAGRGGPRPPATSPR